MTRKVSYTKNYGESGKLAKTSSRLDYAPFDDYQARLSTHIGKARAWAGLEEISFTEYGQTNRATAQDQILYNQGFAFGLTRMREENASFTLWADGQWGDSYNVALVNRVTDENYSTLDAALPYMNGNQAFRGVNWAILEFGGGPSWFTAPTAEQVQRYADAGANVIRLPITSVYMQPTSNLQALDASYMQLVDDSINNIYSTGMQVILNIHDYCKYRDVAIVQGTAEQTGYHDMLDKLLNYSISDGNGGTVPIKDHPGLYALEIMNEPHNAVSTAAWEVLAQEAVTYIRSTINWSGKLLIATGSFSGVHSVDSYHPDGPFITDPQNNFTWVLHYYPNSYGQFGNWDGTFQKPSGPDGVPATYAEELASASSFANQGQFNAL